MPFYRLYSLVTVYIALPQIESTGFCYYPDGNINPDGAPSDAIADVGMCCMSTNGFQRLTNGLYAYAKTKIFTGIRFLKRVLYRSELEIQTCPQHLLSQ